MRRPAQNDRNCFLLALECARTGTSPSRPNFADSAPPSELHVLVDSTAQSTNPTESVVTFRLMYVRFLCSFSLLFDPFLCVAKELRCSEQRMSRAVQRVCRWNLHRHKYRRSNSHDRRRRPVRDRLRRRMYLKDSTARRSRSRSISASEEDSRSSKMVLYFSFLS